MLSLDFDVIKIIDDDLNSALQSQYIVEDFGVKTELITNGPYRSVKDLLPRILGSGGRMGVLCDHRLMHGAFANFYGSEFVAELYKNEIPAILLTQFSDSDIDISIRKYRRWMPVMIPRDQLGSDAVPLGLNFCEREIRGVIPSSRQPHRTLVEVIGYTIEQSEEIAEAYVPGWSTDHVVRFPLSLMGDMIKDKTIRTIRKDVPVYVFAQVNVGAAQASELFFDKFEWALEAASSPLDSLIY